MIEFDVLEAELMPLIWALAKLQPHQVLAVKVPAGEDITPFMNGPIAAAVLAAAGRFGYEHDQATSRVWITRMPAHPHFMAPDPEVEPETAPLPSRVRNAVVTHLESGWDPRDPKGEDEEAFVRSRRASLNAMTEEAFSEYTLGRRHLAGAREAVTQMILDTDLNDFRSAKNSWHSPAAMEAFDRDEEASIEEARVGRIEQAIEEAVAAAPVVASDDDSFTLAVDLGHVGEPQACVCDFNYRSVAEPTLKGNQSWHDRGDWHEGGCPRHAHRWKLPGAGETQDWSAIEGRCRCGEVKAHTNSLATSTPQPTAKGICPDCGGAFASLLHRQCKAAKEAAEKGATV